MVGEGYFRRHEIGFCFTKFLLDKCRIYGNLYDFPPGQALVKNRYLITLLPR